MRNIYKILALSCACFSFASCAKSSNTIKTSLIIPSGAPTLAAYKILTNFDVFDAEVITDATTIPAEFSLGNANFIVFDSINGSNILSKQGENAKYEYVKMLTGGNFHLLAFNKETIDIKDEDVVYGFMSNSTPGKLFRAIYGEIGFDQNFDGVSGVRDSLLQMNENYEVFLVADEQYTENVSESKELENTATGSTQNKINAFDSATASDTDKIETSNSGTGAETNTRAMTYRKQSTGAMFTPQELLQKEIDLRTNNKFLDLVIKDIKNVLCLDVYE